LTELQAVLRQLEHLKVPAQVEIAVVYRVEARVQMQTTAVAQEQTRSKTSEHEIDKGSQTPFFFLIFLYTYPCCKFNLFYYLGSLIKS
jgi:hypothetical protein